MTRPHGRQLGIKATGSVWASVQNRHSAPGPYVMSADWLVKLSKATGDSRYAQVFYDNALNIAQYATTEKNHFMPKGDPGTLTERVNTCDWEGRGRIGAVMARDSNQAWENVALHPNDPGYQRMADEIIRAFLNLIPCSQTQL